MKNKYTSPEFDLVKFAGEEVMTASAVITTKDDDQSITLPFVPAK